MAKPDPQPVDLEAEYNVRAGRPDFDDVVLPSWLNRSERFRDAQRNNSSVGLAYGDSPRRTLDVFRCGSSHAPTFVFFHGGYWQRGDTSIYSFIAEPFLRGGVNVILVGYDLCPQVKITDIVGQARQAILFIWKQSTQLGIDANKVVVGGHSAGGHITGMLAATDWPALTETAPRNLIKAFIPISPLNSLPVLRSTSIDKALQMSETESLSQSPINNPPLTDAPQLIVVGAQESRSFHWQSDIYAAAFATPSRPIERYDVPEADHIDEIDILARDDSVLFAKCLGLIKSVTRQIDEAQAMSLLDEMFDAFNRHDAEFIANCFTEDGVMLAASGAEITGRKFAGPSEIFAALSGRFQAAPDIQWTEATTWMTGNRAVSEWRVMGTLLDGTRIDTRGCDLYEFRDGKLSKKDTFYKQRT